MTDTENLHLPDIISRVRRFIETTFLFQFGQDVDDTDDLFKSGLIDSFGYMSLIVYLEEECGITLGEPEMLSNVLVSFRQIAAFLTQKLAEQH